MALEKKWVRLAIAGGTFTVLILGWAVFAAFVLRVPAEWMVTFGMLAGAIVALLCLQLYYSLCDRAQKARHQRELEEQRRRNAAKLAEQRRRHDEELRAQRIRHAQQRRDLR